MENRESLSTLPKDSDRTHIRLLFSQLDDIYQVMKAERSAIA